MPISDANKRREKLPTPFEMINKGLVDQFFFHRPLGLEVALNGGPRSCFPLTETNVFSFLVQ